MENVSTTSVDSKSSRELAGSIIKTRGGTNIKELIEKGREWIRQKKEQGWFETPDGLLPMIEIQKAGFVWNDEYEEVWDREQRTFIRKQRGYNAIPATEYISDGIHGDRKAGEKFVGPTQQYLYWRENRKALPIKKIPEEYIDEQINVQPELTGIINKDGEIDQSRIPF